MRADVTVVGTGIIGSAVAQTFLSRGRRVAVWNRTHERTARLQAAGALAPATLSAAIAASPLTVVCVLDYPSARSLLSEPAAVSALSRTTLLMFSTGSAADARAMAEWADEHGIDYLDGVIDCYPAELGTPLATTLYGGPATLFDRHQALLAVLGGEVSYQGEDVGRPAVLEQTELIFVYAAVLAFLQMAAIGEAEGIAPPNMLSHLKRRSPITEAVIERMVPRLVRRDYTNPESTLDVDVHAALGLSAECRRLGLDPALTDLFVEYLRAAAVEHGTGDISALYERIRPNLELG